MTLRITKEPLFKGTRIFFGRKPQTSSEANSTPTKPTEESLPKQGWTEEEFKKGEEALNNLFK